MRIAVMYSRAFSNSSFTWDASWRLSTTMKGTVRRRSVKEAADSENFPDLKKA